MNETSAEAHERNYLRERVAKLEAVLVLADGVVGQCDCIDGQTAADSPKAAYRKARAALAPSQARVA
jgi:hypothetical protein